MAQRLRRLHNQVRGHGGREEDGWLVDNDKDTDNLASDGGGGYVPQIRFPPGPADDDEVGGALAAPTLTQFELPAPWLASPSRAGSLLCRGLGRRLLGNASKPPYADCVSAADCTADSAGLPVGVDLQAPTINLSPASPKENDEEMRDVQGRRDLGEVVAGTPAWTD